MLGKLFKSKKVEIDNKFVFDKAKYHFETIDKDGLDEIQAYVHTGFYFSWLVKNNLVSDFLISESGDLITKTKNETVTPCDLYMNWDGVLIGELLNKEGFNFSVVYFDFDKGDFVNDYINTFDCKDPNFFKVEPNWTNYHKIEKVIDDRYYKWKKNWR